MPRITAFDTTLMSASTADVWNPSRLTNGRERLCVCAHLARHLQVSLPYQVGQLSCHQAPSSMTCNRRDLVTLTSQSKDGKQATSGNAQALGERCAKPSPHPPGADWNQGAGGQARRLQGGDAMEGPIRAVRGPRRGWIGRGGKPEDDRQWPESHRPFAFKKVLGRCTGLARTLYWCSPRKL